MRKSNTGTFRSAAWNRNAEIMTTGAAWPRSFPCRRTSRTSNHSSKPLLSVQDMFACSCRGSTANWMPLRCSGVMQSIVRALAEYWSSCALSHGVTPLAIQIIAMRPMEISHMQESLSQNVLIYALLQQFASSSGRHGDIWMLISMCPSCARAYVIR